MKKEDAVINVEPLGFLWNMQNPFLFCAHHKDDYPKANGEYGPDASLSGRQIGQDFTLKDGWRMYHGDRVPGFPVHPHRGFETVTIVLNGFVDHSDSHGAAGRYGNGDVQWMTAGSGLQHAEMFPLLKTDEGNPLELFQVWLNLPKSRKFCPPWFKMLWADEIPVLDLTDENGKKIQVRLIAGELGDIKPPVPAPDSWAAEAENEVAIWLVTMQPGARWILPHASRQANRTLYFYEGESIELGNYTLPHYHSAVLDPRADLLLVNGAVEGRFLLLQGRPIHEPIVQYGPFVMNSEAEIRQAFADYRQTQFGGWPWDRRDPVHGPDLNRFAKYHDGNSDMK